MERIEIRDGQKKKVVGRTVEKKKQNSDRLRQKHVRERERK